MAFKGANIELDLAGPNLALLTPLTGIPLPETPTFRLSGRLDYQDQRVRFRDFSGTVGKSDLEGTIAVDPAPQRPKVDLDLRSKRVDLVDLGGFIGAPPKNAKPGSETAEQKQEQRAAANSSKVLPDTPINLPKLQFADVDLRYRGERIEGRSIPLDNLTVAMTIKDGAVSLHPVSFGVGKGEISSQISLEPRDQSRLHATVATDFRQVDVSRLLAATHALAGPGQLAAMRMWWGTETRSRRF